MKMKMNKSLTTGSILIGLGLSAAAVYAVAPAVKNLTSNMTNKNSMTNDSNNNSSFDKKFNSLNYNKTLIFRVLKLLFIIYIN